MFYRDAKFWRRLQCLKHSVINALALGRHWRFWSFDLKGGWQIFKIQGGWPMSDNEIFQGVQNPEDTMSLILAILKPSVP